MSSPILNQVTSVKVKLGLLVAVSVTVASILAATGAVGGVPFWLTVPVTVALALGITQLLAVGMTSPLREMTAAARGMARGDYSARVTATSSDEVGELARAFNRMAEDLAAVDRQRRELVANVSHELRTPLAALCAVLENLVDGVAEPDPVALRTALDQAERLAALASDLLDLARVNAGKAKLSTTEVEVCSLLEQAVAEAKVSGREVRYEVEVMPTWLTVPADLSRLHQLVANLLDNASRHSPAGGVVRLGALATADGWRLEVTDEGPGIPAADRDRVFERFGTLAETEGGGGTGLGLAIARWVTDLHGGTIHFVEPEPATSGARVRVDLPRQPRQLPTVTHVPAKLPEQAKEPAMSQPVTPAPPTLPAPAGPSVPESPMDALFGKFWPDARVPGNVRAVLYSLAAGLLAGIILPFRDMGIGYAVVILTAGGVILTFSANRRSRFTQACAVLCVLLAITTVVRDAEWIVVQCILAAGVLCVAGLVNGRTVPAFILSGISLPLAGLRGLPWLGRSLQAVTSVRKSAAAVRTVIWSVLGVLVFGLLFASADALFKKWAGAIVPDLHLDSFVLRAFLTVFIGGIVLAATYLGLNPPNVETATRSVRPVASRYEWLAPVLLVDAVFLVFLIAQATASFGGHEYVERITGLTYAEYVHQGFGQLTVATALTLLVVWAAARKAPRTTTADVAWLRSSLGVLCVLTLVVVASALYRMHLYQEAYGFTQLRLLVDVFEGWLGL
ncbi:MAG: two-component system, OmpR family, sensor histidine kinase BaeS, partial [Kribbellaceae bacterium]|nr:two-component system, OmpR family, sensor histidine kinase BaeS [Kribbellaceae bacterium]